jgi:hypothetical protein
MLNPFRTLGSTFRDLFDEFLLLIMCNLIWMAVCAPLWWFALIISGAGAPLFGVLIALLGVVPAGPATLALTVVSLRISEGRATSVGDFLRAFRTFPRQGWALMGGWIAGVLILLFNMSFYLGWQDLIGGLMLGIWFYALLVWMALLIYAFPLLLLQEEPNLRLVVRNAALMALGRPVFTGVTLLLMGVWVGLSVVLVVPVLMITVAVLNLWSVRATVALIEFQRARQEAEAAAATPNPPSEERGRKGQVRPK